MMEQILERIMALAENNLNILVPLYVFNEILGRILDVILLCGIFLIFKKVVETWSEWMKKPSRWD